MTDSCAALRAGRTRRTNRYAWLLHDGWNIDTVIKFLPWPWRSVPIALGVVIYNAVTAYRQEGALPLDLRTNLPNILFILILVLPRVLAYCDAAIRRGSLMLPTRRKWADEVVVVTGGGSGLGREVVHRLCLAGAKAVVILDVAHITPFLDADISAGDAERVFYYGPCDITNREAVCRVRDQIIQEHGSPTIIVSNAGTVTTGPVDQHDTRPLATLLNSQWILASVFLSGLLEGRSPQWLTVGSTLGSVGVPRLSSYCAAKAGVQAFHEALTVEQHGRLTTTLVCPGQLDSPMFDGMKTPSSFLAPILSSSGLAKEIVGLLTKQQAGEYGYPFYAQYISILRILPSGLRILLVKLAGIQEASSQWALEKGERARKRD
ncbi:hypothetical protein PYCC9005_002980 [Savitreella phatthalungensis]